MSQAGNRAVGIQSYTPRITSKGSSTSTILIADKDPSRHFVSLFNASTAVLTLLMAGGQDLTGADALLTAGRKTIDIAAGGYFEVPTNYVGEVYGKWASVNGTVEVTEYR